MIENCSVIFYARDGCESFCTAKTHSSHGLARGGVHVFLVYCTIFD